MVLLVSVVWPSLVAIGVSLLGCWWGMERIKRKGLTDPEKEAAELLVRLFETQRDVFRESVTHWTTRFCYMPGVETWLLRNHIDGVEWTASMKGRSIGFSWRQARRLEAVERGRESDARAADLRALAEAIVKRRS